MKLRNNEVKKCSLDWKENIVLELKYTHKKEELIIQIKDYNEDTYEYVLKQANQKAKEYFLTKEKWASQQN